MTDPDLEIVVQREIGAPPDVVFAAFTHPAHLAAWWGPDGFSLTTESFEFAEGGHWVFVMHGPDGTDYPNWIEFREIVAPERLVVLHGSRRDDPEAFTSVFTLAPSAHGTTLVLRSLFPTVVLRNRAVEEYGALEGAHQTLGRLADHCEDGSRP